MRLRLSVWRLPSRRRCKEISPPVECMYACVCVCMHALGLQAVYDPRGVHSSVPQDPETAQSLQWFTAMGDPVLRSILSHRYVVGRHPVATLVRITLTRRCVAVARHRRRCAKR